MNDEIRAATVVLQAEAARLTAMIRAKGYPKTHVEIWFGRVGYGGDLTTYVDNPPREMPFTGHTASIDDAIAQIETAIAKTPDINAYAEWFAWPQAESAE